jgi:hypothetical protein
MTERTPQELIDDFLKHLDNGDYIIRQDEKYVTFYRGGTALDSIRGSFERAIIDYTEKKFEALEHPENAMSKKLANDCAITCVSLMRKARMNNLIEENPSFRTQLEAKSQENERCKELNYKLANENVHLKKQIEELHKTMARFSPVKKTKEDDK